MNEGESLDLGRIRTGLEDVLAEAERVLAARRGLSPAELGTREKGPGDFVTRVDGELEELFRRRLCEGLCPAGFLGEESGLAGDPRGLLWVVDPIDGTTNFSRHLEPFGFSLALVEGGIPLVGGLSIPGQGWRLSAARGQGLTCRGESLRLAPATLDVRALLGLGVMEPQEYGGWVSQLAAPGCRVRFLGSAVAHLAGCALGRLDLAAQARTRVWDVAAGILAVVEAGGRACRFDGSPLLPFREEELAGEGLGFLAGSGQAVRQALALLHGSDPGDHPPSAR